jgi:hypothetical protein
MVKVGSGKEHAGLERGFFSFYRDPSVGKVSSGLRLYERCHHNEDEFSCPAG